MVGLQVSGKVGVGLYGFLELFLCPLVVWIAVGMILKDQSFKGFFDFILRSARGEAKDIKIFLLGDVH